MDDKTLRFAYYRGILDYATIQDEVIRMNELVYLDKHNGKIWKDPSGRWSTYLKGEDGKNRLVKKTRIEDLQKTIIEYYKKIYYVSFEEVFKKWLDRKLYRSEIQKQSFDRYQYTFERYIKNSELNKISFELITEEILDNFIINTIKSLNLSSKQWADLRLVIRGTFKYAYKNGYSTIHIDSFMDDMELSPKIFRPRVRDDSKQVFTNKEVKQITDVILNEEPCKMVDLGILLALTTGLRTGELISLKWSDYDKENGTLHISRTEVRTKNNKGYDYIIRESTKGREGYRTIVLMDDAINILEKMEELNPYHDKEYIYKNHHGTIFTNRLYRICDSLKIPHRSMHKCRKTYATRLINGHVPDVLVTSQLGHTDITTTRNYYYFNNMDIDESREYLKRVK